MIPDINLLPPIKRKSNNSKLVFWTIGVLALLILTYLIWQYFEARSNSITLQAEEQTLIAQRDELKVEYDALLSQNQGTLEGSVAFVERVSYKVSPLIDETQNLLQEHTYLRNYSFTDKSLQITVDFETISAMSSYVEALENSAYFTDVQVGAVSNFFVTPAQLVNEENRFDEVPRYSVTLTLAIEMLYIALGGVEE